MYYYLGKALKQGMLISEEEFIFMTEDLEASKPCSTRKPYPLNVSRTRPEQLAPDSRALVAADVLVREDPDNEDEEEEDDEQDEDDEKEDEGYSE
jgi:hypothetical protein